MIAVTETNFEQEVMKSDLPVVVDSWAPWCKPCQVVTTLGEKLASDYEGRVKFCRLNLEENSQMAARYSITSIPFLLFFKEGQPVEQLVGAVTESKLRSKVQEFI